MTSDTCGPTSGTPFASYDPESRSWRTSEATSLWALTLSSLTLPNWGCLHDGVLYALPTPEPRTDALDSSSSLPTPTARDYKDGALGPRMQDGRGHGELPQVIAENFLPTPTAADGLKMSSNPATSARRREKGNQASLTDIVQTEMLPPDQRHWLLPTPVADHSRGLPQPGTDFQSLPNVAISLLPTPRARLENNDDVSRDRGKRNLEDQISALLPTPTAQAAKHGETPDTTANGFGSNLWDLPTLIGGSTPPRLTAGSASSTAPHPAPPSPAPTDDPDCLPLSWNG